MLPETWKTRVWNALSVPRTRADLAAQLDVPRTSLYDVLTRLERAGLVVREQVLVPERGKGRPMVQWRRA